MRETFAKLVRYKWAGISLALAATLVLTGWIWAFVRLYGLSQITVHFNDYVGINRVAGITDLHAFGVLGLIIVTVNGLIGMALEERDWFFGKLAAFSGLILGILIFIGFMVIMSIN